MGTQKTTTPPGAIDDLTEISGVHVESSGPSGISVACTTPLQFWGSHLALWGFWKTGILGFWVNAASKNFRSLGGNFTNFYRSASSVDSVGKETYSHRAFKFCSTSTCKVTQIRQIQPTVLHEAPHHIPVTGNPHVAQPAVAWRNTHQIRG
jgi:hypothetical protein